MTLPTLPDRFGAIILTHGRADKVYTIRTIRRCGYTGPIRLLIDDEDASGPEYHERYPGEVIEFSKAAVRFDPADNTGDTRSSAYPRNICHEVAAALGWTHFVMLDDDYTTIKFRRPQPGPGTWWGATYGSHPIHSLDAVFGSMCRLLDETGILTVAMAQGGDNIGGAKSGTLRSGVKRKAMNSHVIRTAYPVGFLGRLNEDVNAYCVWGMRGKVFLQTTLLQLEQGATQQTPGGMTEAYRDGGTYVKSFYSVMMCPSFVDIRMMGRTDRRLHHRIDWDHAVPKIIAPELRK